MDKYEYKHLADQIQYLIDQKEYAQAAAIADTIDWRRVRSVMMLGTISDLYKINNRYEDARDIMLMAYDRKPENRQVCYSLCELFIKTGEMANAVEFYKEYAQLAPKDAGQYILQYKMYEANNVSLEERAEVLEALKKHEYQEKWMYELAYLYHRMELETKCVEVCDELILWFGSGEYVNKALELKRLHAPLTPEQQEKYDNRFRVEEEPPQEEYEAGETGGDEAEEGSGDEAEVSGDTRVFDVEEVRSQLSRGEVPKRDTENLVKIIDVGKYNTMNLQAELAAGVNEVLGADSITRAILEPMMEPETEFLDTAPMAEDYEEPEEETVEGSEVYFGETGEFARYADYSDFEEDDFGKKQGDSIADKVMEQMRSESLAAQEKLEKEAMTAQPPEPLAKVLAQESDGQLRLVLPEGKKLEKQITGQISIEDIRVEWEKMKQESREKQEEEVRQHVLRQTGKMFTKFEEALRDNILKQMEEKEDSPLYEMPDEQETAQWEQEDGPEQASASEWDMGETEAGTDQSYDDSWAREVSKEAIEKPQEELSGESGAVSGEIAEEQAIPEEMTEAAELSEESAEAQAIPEESTETAELSEESAEAQAIPEEASEAAELSEESAEAQAIPEEESEAEFSEESAERQAIPENISEAAGELPAEPQENVPDPAREAAESVPLAEDPMDEEPWENGVIPGGKAQEESSADQAPAAETEKATDEKENGEAAQEVAAESAGEPVREAGEAAAEEPAKEPGADAAGDQKEAAAENSAKTPSESEEEAEKETSAGKGASSVRAMTEEETELFGDLVRGHAVREQLVQAIDGASMAAYAGNVIVTAEESSTALEVAGRIVREIKMTDGNFSGVAARISAAKINKRNIPEMMDQLRDGALIVDKASELGGKILADMYKCMQQENYGLLVVLTDTRKKMNRFLKENRKFASMFTSRVDLQPLSNDVLAEYAQEYAKEKEFSIDDLGTLALHLRIDEMQTAQHSVTKAEIEEIMDAAIENASAKTLGHFFDILFGKRYDSEDMIIITEKDFI